MCGCKCGSEYPSHLEELSVVNEENRGGFVTCEFIIQNHTEKTHNSSK